MKDWEERHEEIRRTLGERSTIRVPLGFLVPESVPGPYQVTVGKVAITGRLGSLTTPVSRRPLLSVTTLGSLIRRTDRTSFPFLLWKETLSAGGALRGSRVLVILIE